MKSSEKQNDQNHQTSQTGKWVTINKNTGIIQVRWWIPLIIVVGAFITIILSYCVISWFHKSRGTAKQPSAKSPIFKDQPEAEKAYLEMYKQIGSFCRTVKSPS